MKKRLLILFALLFVPLVLSAPCDLSISMLNQDPYPAIPGDYVKILFQVGGITDSSCGDLSFNLIDKYPISFDDSSDKKISIKSGTFVKDFSSHATIAYKVRVNPDALDGDNKIELAYSRGEGNQNLVSKEFNLFVKDTRANFEIYVKNFDFKTNDVTFEILNTAKVDIRSVTIEILPSQNVIAKGAQTKIAGDLDSNEYTTFDFEIEPQKTTVNMRIYYTDDVGIRRQIDKSVLLDPSFFEGRKTPEKSSSPIVNIFIIIAILLIVYKIYKKRNKKK